MRKHGGTPSRRDKHVTLAAFSPPSVVRGRFVGGQQSGLAGCKPPPLFTRGASSCSSQGRRQGNQGAPLHHRVHLPTYLPTPGRSRRALPVPPCDSAPGHVIEQDYPAYAYYSLLFPLVGFRNDTKLMVAHTPHEPHTLGKEPTVTQQADDLREVTISYLSQNNLIADPTKSVAMLKGKPGPPPWGHKDPA